MSLSSLQEIAEFEHKIINLVRAAMGTTLKSIMVEGSYGTYDHIPGYSDYDLAIITNDKHEGRIPGMKELGKSARVDLQWVFCSYQDILNRIDNNCFATRFVSNMRLILFKESCRIIDGKDFTKCIPEVSVMTQRDLGEELRAQYLYATNPRKAWNIFLREPRKWCNYIINMANSLLLSKGVIVRKSEIADQLKVHFPGFNDIDSVLYAVELRRTQEVLSLSTEQTADLNCRLESFLEAYRIAVF